MNNCTYKCVFISTAVQCEFLTAPENGQVVLTGITFGSTASYNCLPGFNIVGSATRTCQENGQWSGQAPTCAGLFSPFKSAIPGGVGWSIGS